MIIKKVISGQYRGEAIVDGYNVRVEIESYDQGGFSFSWYVNDYFQFGDGWIGLRLKDIKAGLDDDIQYVIKEYKGLN